MCVHHCVPKAQRCLGLAPPPRLLPSPAPPTAPWPPRLPTPPPPPSLARLCSHPQAEEATAWPLRVGFGEASWDEEEGSSGTRTSACRLCGALRGTGRLAGARGVAPVH